MRVIFLKDVPPNARAGDIKIVKNGFGRNFLLPNGLAALATRDAVARSEGLRREAEQRRLADASDWNAVAEGLAETPIVVQARSGPTGRLYGSVTSAIVAQRISEMTGRDIDRRTVRFPAPVRQTGQFNVAVRLYEDIEVEIKLVVEAEGGAPQVEAAAADAPGLPDGKAGEDGAAGESADSAPSHEASEGESRPETGG